MRIEERITIGRRPEEVWDFVVEHTNDPQWCPKVKAVEQAGDRRWKVWHRPVPLLPAALLEMKHVREHRPTYLAIREEDGAAVFEVEYRLEQAVDGTVFTQVSEFAWKRLPRVLWPLFRFGVRRDVARQLRALKQAIER